ncbi:hypothetical protein JTE90_008911 [Oedothorax gibbosus]|uniref:PiggyBac transposable element-derived protein domain-containing protein n=1 Tax=Oedothorax gibbosus TaxID=931172 RepID=A0AAV6UKT7_9ARAC|nr:hypothetical protein JTE90_008911 [Oedothorax gibbosus]
MSKRKRALTQSEIEEILFTENTSGSELSSEDDGWPTASSANASFIDNSALVTNLDDTSDEDGMNTDDENDEENMEEDVGVDGATSAEDKDKKNKVFWSTDVKDDKIDITTHFKVGGGPKHNLPVGSEVVDYFKLIFNDDMCEEIRENTNKYAEFVKESTPNKWEPIGNKKWTWKPISHIQEMWNYLTILMIMGIAKLPRLQDYWSANPILGDCMNKVIAQIEMNEILCYCKPSCKETNYGYSVSSSKLNENFYKTVKAIRTLRSHERGHHNITNTTGDSTMVGLKVYYDTFQVGRDKEVATYSWETMVANVGGNFGFFMGLTLITFVEVLEFLWDLLLNACRKKRRTEHQQCIIVSQ